MTDMCDACSGFRDRQEFENLFMHLDEVKVQRDYIRHLKLQALRLGEAWIEADYAERLRLPRFFFQPKQFYFQSGIAVDLFGVVNARSGTQTNFLAVEGSWPEKKGIESVGSYWFHVMRYGSSLSNHDFIY